MTSPRTFTEQELTLARQMRADRKGWASIGRELKCHESTIRAALDPTYDYAAKVRKNNEAARLRERAAASAKAEKQSIAAKAYDNNLESFL